MHAREKFDPNRDFIVIKTFKWNGTIFRIKEPFNKALASLRRLRQMYDGRWLAMAPINLPTELKPLKAVMPNFSVLAAENLKHWLENNGYKDPLPEDKDELVQIAKDHWKTLYPQKNDPQDSDKQANSAPRVNKLVVSGKKKVGANGKSHPNRDSQPIGQRSARATRQRNSTQRNSLGTKRVR